MIRLVNPSKPRSANDSPLWTLQHGERRAQAIAREVPGVGIELVVTIDGELRWAKLYRSGIGLGMEAAAKRQALLDKGWVEAPAPEPR